MEVGRSWRGGEWATVGYWDPLLTKVELPRGHLEGKAGGIWWETWAEGGKRLISCDMVSDGRGTRGDGESSCGGIESRAATGGAGEDDAIEDLGYVGGGAECAGECYEEDGGQNGEEGEGLHCCSCAVALWLKKIVVVEIV